MSGWRLDSRYLADKLNACRGVLLLNTAEDSWRRMKLCKKSYCFDTEHALDAMNFFLHCIDLKSSTVTKLFECNAWMRSLSMTGRKITGKPESAGNYERRLVRVLIDGIRRETFGKQNHFHSPQFTLRAKHQLRRKRLVTRTGVGRYGLELCTNSKKYVV